MIDRPHLALALLLFASACETAPSSGGPPGAGSGAPSGAGAVVPGATATREEPRPPRPANQAESAIVAPLAPGADLAGYQVKKLEWEDPGLLDVVLQKGAARIVLTVAMLGKGGLEPPAQTARYAVFYSLRGADPDDGERTAKALAAVLEANESAPPPPGLAAFVPRPRSL